MVCVGIDVAKDKHDCCILDSDGMVRADCFTIPNNMDGFKQLLQTIRNCTKKSDKIKVGLEAKMCIRDRSSRAEEMFSTCFVLLVES